MFAIKNADIYIVYLMMAITLVPLISIIGHVFTRDGREAMKVNPLLPIYFILYIGYAYLFWCKSAELEYWLGMSFNVRVLLYGFMCFIPLLRRDLPN